MMTLYINTIGKLKEVKEKPFKLEKDIQKLFEANLDTLMNLQFVKSEFTIKGKRIDHNNNILKKNFQYIMLKK